MNVEACWVGRGSVHWWRHMANTTEQSVRNRMRCGFTARQISFTMLSIFTQEEPVFFNVILQRQLR